MIDLPPARRRSIACGLALVGAIAVSGCGGGDDTTAAPASEETALLPDEADRSIAPIAPLSIERLPIGGGEDLDFVVVLPPGYTKGDRYPTAVALPPGDQAEGIAESTVQQLFFRQARERGWIVISPIAPEGRLFFDGSHRRIPRLLKRLESRFPPEGGKYHLVGLSNGGVSAFKLAIARPTLFQSLVVFPGFPRGLKDQTRLRRLQDVPVRMMVGQLDAGWVEPMRRTDIRLRRLGVDATLQVEPGEGHFIGTVDGERLFETLEPLRPEEPDQDPVVAS